MTSAATAVDRMDAVAARAQAEYRDVRAVHAAIGARLSRARGEYMAARLGSRFASDWLRHRRSEMARSAGDAREIWRD